MKFFITFGFSHPLGHSFLEIEADNENQAREAASACFPGWANITHTEPTDLRNKIVSKVNADIAIKVFG